MLLFWFEKVGIGSDLPPPPPLLGTKFQLFFLEASLTDGWL